MLTPIEIENTTFKSAASGYNKSQVEAFRNSVMKDYELLYRKNLEYEDKIAGLNERLSYYSSIEKSLHKALVLAEKSAEETKINADKQAKLIEQEAQNQAQIILSDARRELYRLHDQTLKLMEQYETYKATFIHMMEAQKDVLNSNSFQINVEEFEAYTTYLKESLVEDKSISLKETKVSKEEKSEA